MNKVPKLKPDPAIEHLKQMQAESAERLANADAMAEQVEKARTVPARPEKDDHVKNRY